MAKDTKTQEEKVDKPSKEKTKTENVKTEEPKVEAEEAKKDPADEFKEKALSAFNILAQKTKEQVAKAQDLAEKHHVKEKFFKGLVTISGKLNEKALELEKKMNPNSENKSEEKNKKN